MRNIETTAMRQNRKRPFKMSKFFKCPVPKYKETNTTMNRRNWSNTTITLKTDIILNRTFTNKLNMQKPKKRILNLIMVIRNNRNILYFTKYIHIKNGWRI